MSNELTGGGGDSAVCLDCGEKLLGRYCSRCGQEAVDLHRPLRELVSSLVDDVLYLPLALRRVYGGSRWRTALKLFGLGAAYAFVFGCGVALMVFVTLTSF